MERTNGRLRCRVCGKRFGPIGREVTCLDCIKRLSIEGGRKESLYLLAAFALLFAAIALYECVRGLL